MNEKGTLHEYLSRSTLAFGVGLSLLFAGYWAGRQLHTVWNSWPVVDGVVTNSAVAEILEVPIAKGDGEFHQYQPSVNLRYQVGGQEYTTELPLGYTTTTYQQASADLQSHHAPGTHQAIRYNPRNARDIRFGGLDRGPLAFSFLLIIAGVALCVEGSKDLLKAFWLRMASKPELKAPRVTLPFEGQAPAAGATATLRCPACGRTVEAGQDSCPNCLKSLRAA